MGCRIRTRVAQPRLLNLGQRLLSSSGSGDYGSGFKVQGSGLRVEGLGLRVEG